MKVVTTIGQVIERSTAEGTLALQTNDVQTEPDRLSGTHDEDPEEDWKTPEGLVPRIPDDALTERPLPRCDPFDPPVDPANCIAEDLNRWAEGIEIHAPCKWTETDAAGASSFEPIEVPASFESGIAYELNRASECLEIARDGAPGAGDRERPSRLQTSLAAGIPDDGQSETRRSTPGGPLDQAIRLTRDATLAWMRVLRGQPTVAMTSR
jgi:hypothetical protein